MSSGNCARKPFVATPPNSYRLNTLGIFALGLFIGGCVLALCVLESSMILVWPIAGYAAWRFISQMLIFEAQSAQHAESIERANQMLEYLHTNQFLLIEQSLKQKGKT